MIPTLYNNVTVRGAERGPSKTIRLDPDTKRLAGVIDGRAAVEQMATLALNIERFSRPTLSPRVGIEFDGLIGKDRSYVLTAIEGRIKGAIEADDRVISVTDFKAAYRGDTLTVDFTINTIFGAVRRSGAVMA